MDDLVGPLLLQVVPRFLDPDQPGARDLNYHLFRELLAQRVLERVTKDPRLRRLVQWFNRRPFLTTWFVAWSPLPDWTIRILAPLSRYPVGPWLVAMGLGRFPRFWLLASLGGWMHLDARLLGGLAVLPLCLVGFGLIRARLRRRLPAAGRCRLAALPASEGCGATQLEA